MTFSPNVDDYFSWARSGDRTLVRRVADDWNSPEVAIDYVVGHTADHTAMVSAAGNPTTSPEALATLFSVGDARIRRLVLARPNCPSHLAAMASLAQ
jgi:hypothetical protein